MIKRFLEAIPIPIAGIILAFASLGNLLQNVFTKIIGLEGLGYILYLICGVITTILIILMVLKIIFCFKMVVIMLENPEVMGVFAAFSMALMVYAGYIATFVDSHIAQIFWWFGVILHYTCMVVFTYKYVVKDFEWPKLLPPWFIVYVGFSLSGFDAANYAPGWFGVATFWFGFICFWILFFMIIHRVRIKPVPQMDEPTFCIFAAIGISLTTLVRNFTDPSPIAVLILFVISNLIWLWLMFRLPKWMKLPYYPTDSAFSFPFVVSAIASLETMRSLMAQGIMIGAWDRPIVLVQTAVAVIMVGFASWRYLKHIIQASKEKNPGMRMMQMNMMNVSRNMQMKEGMSPEEKAEMSRAIHMKV